MAVPFNCNCCQVKAIALLLGKWKSLPNNKQEPNINQLGKHFELAIKRRFI